MTKSPATSSLGRKVIAKLFALSPLLCIPLLAVALAEGPRLARWTGLSGVLPSWPIKAVTVTGELRQVARQELEDSIVASLSEDFFSVDVSAIREVALATPWIEEVAVRKVWPDKFHIQVCERQAVGRWAAGGLVDRKGVLFFPTNGAGLDGLPVLSGPDRSQLRLLERFEDLRRDLRGIGLAIERVELDPRIGLNLRFAGGLEMVLGHAIGRSQLQRIATHLPETLGARLINVQRIDLRYTNGFAVRWRPTQNTLAMGGAQ